MDFSIVMCEGDKVKGVIENIQISESRHLEKIYYDQENYEFKCRGATYHFSADKMLASIDFDKSKNLRLLIKEKIEFVTRTIEYNDVMVNSYYTNYTKKYGLSHSIFDQMDLMMSVSMISYTDPIRHTTMDFKVEGMMVVPVRV